MRSMSRAPRREERMTRTAGAPGAVFGRSCPGIRTGILGAQPAERPMAPVCPRHGGE
jgi:hypothetical protein